MVQHPDWDIEFKPAIARYDWDQTYDVLEFVYLPQGFNQLINLYGIPAFEVMAIDRLTPYRYRWADQYSDEVFEFLKNFNFSPHNSINERLLRDENNELILDLGGHPKWKNEWVSVNSYSIDDVVSYNNGFYQCITANSDDVFITSNWKKLIFSNYIWSDTGLRKFDYIQYSGKYFVAEKDGPYFNPPIDDDGEVDNDWVEISVNVPKFEYDADKYNEFFDLSSHPKVAGKWKRQDYLKGDIVEWEGKYYIATSAISIDRNSYSPLSGFVQPYLMQWDQTDIQEFQLDNIVLYHDGKYYMPLMENATLLLWNDRSLPPPTLNSSDWTEIDFISYKTTLDKGRYQITGLLYQGRQEGLSESINTINQTFKELTLFSRTEIDINKIILNWTQDNYFHGEKVNFFCCNSLIISKLENDNWVNYTPSFIDKPTWLLYDDINTYFNNVKQQLINYFDNIHYGFIDYFDNHYYLLGKDLYPLQNYIAKIKKKDDTDISYTGIRSNYWELDQGEPYYYLRNFWLYSTKFDLTFNKFPLYLLDYCYLQRANNNKWSMQTNYDDLGLKPNSKFLGVNLSSNNIYHPFQQNIDNYTMFVDNIQWTWSPENIYYIGIGYNTAQKKGYGLFRKYLHTVGTGSSYIDCQGRGVGLGNLGGRSVEYYEMLRVPEVYTKEFKHKYSLLLGRGYVSNMVGTNSWNGVSCVWNDGAYYWEEFHYSSFDIEFTDSKKESNAVSTLTKHKDLTKRGVWHRYGSGQQTDEFFTQINIFNRKDFKIEVSHELFTPQEWEELYNQNTITDQQYLDYLLQLKAEWEEQDRIEYEEDQNAR